jgi:hypothetical protein
MSNNTPLYEIELPNDPSEGSGNSLRDERVDDFIKEQEDEEENEIEFGPTDLTPVPNVFQQAWGYGQSIWLFDRSRRRSFIDPFCQSTSPSLIGILPPLRTAVQSQFHMQPVVPPLPPPAQPQSTGNNQPFVPPVQPTAQAATAAPTRPPAAQKPQGAQPKQTKQTLFVLNGEVLLIGQSRQAAPKISSAKPTSIRCHIAD